MDSNGFTRRIFTLRLASMFPRSAWPAQHLRQQQCVGPKDSSIGGEIVHDCEAIHQEVIFKASRKRVYEASPTRNNSTKSSNSAPPQRPGWSRQANLPK